MSVFVDTSVLVAAIVESEEHHGPCRDLLDRRNDLGIYVHGMSETFSTLTGGRRPFRLTAQLAADLIESDYVPCFQITALTSHETLRAMRQCGARGVRGGAIFDYLHLVAARKAKASRLYTLNITNFLAFHRKGDPEIAHPGH